MLCTITLRLIRKNILFSLIPQFYIIKCKSCILKLLPGDWTNKYPFYINNNITFLTIYLNWYLLVYINGSPSI